MKLKISEAIAHVASQKPEKIAWESADQAVTYVELENLALKIASTIQTDSTYIGVLTGQDLYTYASLPACWYAGKAYLPLFHEHPEQRLIEIIQDSGLQMILTSKSHKALEKAAQHTGVQILRTDLLESHSRFQKKNSPEMAYMLYTSGSTGKPKGVPISMNALQAFMESVSQLYHFEPNDRFLQMFELTFDLSVFSTFMPWYIGATTFPLPENNNMTWMNILEILEEKKITVALMVPSVLNYFRPYFDEISLPELKLSMFCGEALSHDLCKEWIHSIPTACIENVYGPTEATIFCMHYTWEEQKSAQDNHLGIVAIGEPIPGMEVFMLNEQNEVANEGELILSGPQLSHGYHHKPEKTAENFIPWGNEIVYRSGDLVKRNQNGVISYIGRKDFQVKIDGHRVELGEIEQRVREILGPVGVVALTHTLENQSVVLYLVVQSEEMNEQDLYKKLAEVLPSYMLPKKILFVTQFPHNSSGKVDRKVLLERALKS